jgi:serine/threonine protein kinase
MVNIILGKIIDKGILSSVYECRLNKKKYIVKIEYVTKDDITNKNSQKQKEIEFSIKFGNKHTEHFMELIHYYFHEDCTIELSWDLNNYPKTWYKKLVNEYKSIINQHICLYKVYTKMDIILNNIINTLTQSQVYSMLLQISYAMNLLHKNNYIHGDLHSGNVGAIKTLKGATIKLGLTTIPTYGYQWKLIDFGLTLHKNDIKTKDDKEKFTLEMDYTYDEGLFYNLVSYIEYKGNYTYDKMIKILKKTEEFKIIEEIHSKNRTIQYGLYETLYPDKFIELFGGKVVKSAILPIPDLIFFAKNGMHSDATFQYLLEKINTK